MRPPWFYCIQVVHDDEHRFGLTFGNEVIHYQIHMALLEPALLVFTPAVEQIENRMAGPRIIVITRRRVNIAAAPFTRDLRVIPTLAHLAVRPVISPNAAERDPKMTESNMKQPCLRARFTLNTRWRYPDTPAVDQLGLVRYTVFNFNRILLL